MSIAQSNITNLNLDLVLGVSQRAVNGILKDYYSNAAKYGEIWPQQVYYTHGMQISRQEALELTNNIDPLFVTAWNGTGTMPADVQACMNADVYAFMFTPGDPSTTVFPEYDYSYVTFIEENVYNPQHTLYYTLVCNAFQAAFYDADNNTFVNFTQSTQPNTPKSQLVQFNVIVPLELQQVAYNPSDTTLPQDLMIQAAALSAQNISFAFQNLILGLDKASVSWGISLLPFMSNTGMVYNEKASSFLAAYKAAVTSMMKPLTYSIQQTGNWNEVTVNPTSLEYYINAFVDANGNPVSAPTKDQLNLSTLNYFCSINNNAPATSVQLPWNWLDTDDDAANYNGAMAISKYALAKVLDGQIRPFIDGNLWVPQINCSNAGGSDSWSFDMTRNGVLTSSSITSDNSNGNLLQYNYKVSKTGYGAVNTSDYVQIELIYNTTVLISGVSSITVNQSVELSYYSNVRGSFSSGIPIQNVYKDVYSIIVQANGTLDLQLVSNNPPSFEPPTLPGLTGDENNSFDRALTKSVCEFGPTDLSPMPLGTSQQIFFPGGTTFTFNTAKFNSGNDLTISFTYNNQA